MPTPLWSPETMDGIDVLNDASMNLYVSGVSGPCDLATIWAVLREGLQPPNNQSVLGISQANHPQKQQGDHDRVWALPTVPLSSLIMNGFPGMRGLRNLNFVFDKSLLSRSRRQQHKAGQIDSPNLHIEAGRRHDLNKQDHISIKGGIPTEAIIGILVVGDGWNAPVTGQDDGSKRTHTKLLPNRIDLHLRFMENQRSLRQVQSGKKSSMHLEEHKHREQLDPYRLDLMEAACITGEEPGRKTRDYMRGEISRIMRMLYADIYGETISLCEIVNEFTPEDWQGKTNVWSVQKSAIKELVGGYRTLDLSRLSSLGRAAMLYQQSMDPALC